jgi:ornithine cyclodeaminase/alanine dehydrogenase-like protein (mu-crystallin family)
MDTLLLTRKDIEQLISMKDVVEIVENTFRGMGEGTVVNPTKAALDLGEAAPWPPYKGFMNAMPAYVGWLDSAGLKWVGGFRDNVTRGLPFITSMTMLIDPRTGQFLSVMDGALITNLRTGAQAAVPLKHLHDRRRIRIGLYGAGLQGRTTTRAIAEVFEIEQVKIYDIRRDAAERLAREMQAVVSGQITVVESPEQAVDSDAVVCVTTARDKFLKNSWIAPGMTVLALGSYQECEDALILEADKIIVDHVEQCLHRGALRDVHALGRITEQGIYATIGEVVAGKKPGRTSPTERILCIPLGTGAMDIAVATVVYRRARARGLGQPFAFA